jgi:nucleoside-diphosphate-sugar epimerase
MEMSILITGASGFIGSALIRRLAEEGYDVVGIRKSKWDHNEDGIKQYSCDIANIGALKKVFNKERIETIIHLAGGGGNSACLKDPGRAVLTDVLGTLNLVNVAKKNDIRIIFASSYLAYSIKRERKLPLTEDMKLVPDDFYGALKKTGEEIVKTSQNYVILRLSHIYGYDKRTNSLVLKMVDSAKIRSKINIMGSGNHRFDLLCIDDLCRAIMSILKSGIKNETINIGSGVPVSINEVALSIKRILNKKITIEHTKDEDFVEYPDHYVSIKKMNRLTGWKPRVTLDQGIKQIIESV